MMNEGKIKAANIDNPESWIDSSGDFLFRFAIARVRDAGIAKDLVQETFLAALRSRESFKGHSLARTWLIAILKHKIVDYIRKKIREPFETIKTTCGHKKLLGAELDVSRTLSNDAKERLKKFLSNHLNGAP